MRLGVRVSEYLDSIELYVHIILSVVEGPLNHLSHGLKRAGILVHACGSEHACEQSVHKPCINVATLSPE